MSDRLLRLHTYYTIPHIFRYPLLRHVLVKCVANRSATDDGFWVRGFEDVVLQEV